MSRASETIMCLFERLEWAIVALFLFATLSLFVFFVVWFMAAFAGTTL